MQSMVNADGSVFPESSFESVPSEIPTCSATSSCVTQPFFLISALNRPRLRTTLGRNWLLAGIQRA
jgi:hypothetical protein